MKKLISLLLCSILVLGVFSGCSGSTLKVGYAHFDMTPPEGMQVTLGGDLAGTRDVDAVYDRLAGMCLALTDSDDNTVLMYSLDLLLPGATTGYIRTISKATGVPENRILISVTHCHYAPMANLDQAPTNAGYMALVKEWMIEAGKAAMEDRKEAKMHTASVHMEGMNTVRNYLLADGSVISVETGSPSTPIVGHFSEPDKEMQLIKFTRKGGEDILLMNWQGHHTTSGTGITTQNATISGIERMRVQLKEEHNTLFMFFHGASGDVGCGSRISSEMKFYNYQDYYQHLAETAISQQFKQVKNGKLQLKANKVEAVSKGGTNISVNIYGLSLGEIVFLLVPYEIFSSNGMHIKAESPYDMTFISTITMGSLGYVPDEAAFEHSFYEVNVSKFGKGAGESLANDCISLLKDLKSGK